MKLNILSKSLLVLSVAVSAFSFSQTVKIPKGQVAPSGIIYKSFPDENGIIRCHTMEMDSIRRMNNPSLPSLEEEEIAFQRQIEEYKAQLLADEAKGTPKATLLTIPIIFHVITSGSGATNVAQSRIQAQLDQLNIDYRGLAGSLDPLNADVEIEFCLATTDPSGNTLAEPGINRITTYGAGPFSDATVDGTIKPATSWNPNNYFNVWVANLSGGLLGWAQFPSNSGLGGMPANGGAANTDGVVILHTSVGSEANPNPSGAPYNRGRTLTHEAGHWLGLRHIWGDGGCSVDDFCADTPLSDAANFGCPNTNSCTDPSPNPRDMVENYMDYTDDSCMDIFTEDQKTRMRTVMSVSTRRTTLPNSNACGTAVAVDAGISAIVDPSGSICGSSVTPIVTLRNYGSTTLTSVTIVSNVDGGASSNFNWSGSLSAGATTNVTLPVISPSAGAHTFNASTSNPNGTTDGNAGNNASSTSFTMVPTGNEVTLILETDCYGEETVWQLFNDGGSLISSGGNSNVTIPVTATQSTSTADPNIYANNSTFEINWCLVDDCYEFILWDAYGDGLNGASVAGCSTNGDFTIEDENSNELASMNAANGAFGFSETHEFCINSSGLGLNEQDYMAFSIYPNPSNGIFNVSITDPSVDAQIEVRDVAGRLVYSVENIQTTNVIDLSAFSNGSYMLAVTMNDVVTVKRIVLKK
jgi:hypothetical protein